MIIDELGEDQARIQIISFFRLIIFNCLFSPRRW